MTGLYEAALREPALHAGEHAAYVWAGILFLAPILACDPLPHPPSAIARFSWLMAAMVVMCAAGRPADVRRERALPVLSRARARARALRARRPAAGGHDHVDRRWRGDVRACARAWRCRRCSPKSAANDAGSRVRVRRDDARAATARCVRRPRVDRLRRRGRSADAQAAARARRPARTARSLAQGRALFASSCASCHGIERPGHPGRGPSLHGVGALAADFYLQTGRMPLPSPRAQPMRASPAFSQRRSHALVAYVASFGGPGDPDRGSRKGSRREGQRPVRAGLRGLPHDPGPGRDRDRRNGSVVEPGDTETGRRGDTDGPVRDATLRRRRALSETVNSIARYMQSIQPPDNRGGWGIGRIGPIPREWSRGCWPPPRCG